MQVKGIVGELSVVDAALVWAQVLELTHVCKEAVLPIHVSASVHLLRVLGLGATQFPSGLLLPVEGAHSGFYCGLSED